MNVSIPIRSFPRDLMQVQADEIRLKTQAGVLWMAMALLVTTPGCQVLTTAFIERLNGAFRSRLAVFGRRLIRTRVLARRVSTVERGMYVVGTLYNFCCNHHSLHLANGQLQTPAMASGITDHVWTVSEVLHYRVPPPRWEPPRRRGRRSHALQALIDRWCPHHRLA